MNIPFDDLCLKITGSKHHMDAAGLETINEQRPSSNLNPQVLQALANSLGKSSSAKHLANLHILRRYPEIIISFACTKEGNVFFENVLKLPYAIQTGFNRKWLKD